MKYYMCYCLFLFIIIIDAAVPKKNYYSVNKNKLILLDHLADVLNAENWSDEETPCYNQIQTVIDGVRNSTLWAIMFWDSNQLPTGVFYGSSYQLGNFDGCMQATSQFEDLRAQYCLAEVKLNNVKPRPKSVEPDLNGPAEVFLNTLTKHGRPLNVVTWGVCLPASCGPQSVAKVVSTLLQTTTLPTDNAIVSVSDCQIAGDNPPRPAGFHAFKHFVLILTVIVLVSTYYFTDNEGRSNCVTVQIAKAFCLRQNIHELIRPIPNEIRVVNGIKGLSALIAVLIHYVWTMNSTAVANAATFDKDLDWAFFVVHIDTVTDTFLMISAMLTVLALMSKRDQLENPLLFLFKRYIRLIGALAVVIWYMASVSDYLGSGPIWTRFAGQEREYCARHWPLTLLFLNNYFKKDEMCYVGTWYTSVDFHLTVVGILLVYACARGGRAGRCAAAIFAALALLIPAFLTYWHRIPPYFHPIIQTIIDGRKDFFFNEAYTKTHYRFGAYFVGMILGYYLHHYKATLEKQRINKLWTYVAYATCIPIGFTVMGYGFLMAVYPDNYHPVTVAIYMATNRIIWCLINIGLMLAAEYGTLKFVTIFLSWEVWVPLSRLSYGVYLTHLALIQRAVWTARAPVTQHPFTMFMDSLGVYLMSIMVSFVIWVLVQAPLTNVVNLLLPSSKAPRKTNLKNDEDINFANGIEIIKSKSS